jgi:GNAT superfamily N-acetyltransferase
VYEVDGRIVGDFFLCPIELSSAHNGLARPPGAAFLGFAVTYPDVRGSGAGLALTDASFAWARARGYETMVTDWRETNLLSSRFWPRRGFRTSFMRLHRWIG